MIVALVTLVSCLLACAFGALYAAWRLYRAITDLALAVRTENICPLPEAQLRQMLHAALARTPQEFEYLEHGE